MKRVRSGVAITALLAAMAAGAWAVPATPGEVQARLSEGAADIQTGDLDKAIETYNPLVNVGDAQLRAQARLGLAAAYSQQGHEENALKVLEGTSADQTPLGQAVGDFRGRLTLQMAYKTLAETGTPGHWLDDYARLTQQPDPEKAEWLRALAETPAAGNDAETQTLRVGVLLPLSGKMAPIGQDVMRGMQLAMSNLPAWRGAKIELIPEDTEPGPEQALDAALLAGAKVIVGPVFSRTVEAIAQRAQAAGVPLLALSSDRGVAGNGVHVVPPLPTQQARLVARWAMANGKTTLAGLVPQSPYGTEVFEAFKAEVQAGGGHISGVSYFKPQAVDLGPNVKQLVGGKPISDTVPPFQALFMPMPARTVPLATSQLAYYDLDRAGVQLLGTALWQDNALLAPSAAGARGAVFAAPAPVESFGETFNQAYGAKPIGMAIQGYDLMRVLMEVAALRQWSGKEVETLLTRPDGFYGTGGFLVFRPDGLTGRGLSLVRVENGQFHVIQPALKVVPVALPPDLQPSGESRGWGGWF
jgi:ABC-type branched-subunit amino acid transport system substrate-binding protein